MSTLVTPSAKAHERVKNRWEREIHATTQREWFAYYLKMFVGTPVPWLMLLMCVAFFSSRAVLEIVIWSSAAFILLYVVADVLSAQREFKFYRLGPDLYLGSYLLVALIGIISFLPLESVPDALGSLRWIPLLYLFTFLLELFPGLNRLFTVIVSVGTVTCVYAIIQHFSGFDPIHTQALTFAPVRDHAYFVVRGFYSSPEVLGTMLAMLLPIPAAAYLQGERRQNDFGKWLSIMLTCLISVTVFWTYETGMWLAAFAGFGVILILQGKKPWALLGSLAVTFALMIVLVYTSPGKFFDELQSKGLERAVQQRAEINSQLKLFENHIVIGAGIDSRAAKESDSRAGNLYFQILGETGVLGLLTYLAFILSSLLATYRLWQEIPVSHYWHRVLTSASLGSQVAFHGAGLYWATLSESFVVYLFVLWIAVMAYMREHYQRGLVPDDYCL